MVCKLIILTTISLFFSLVTAKDFHVITNNAKTTFEYGGTFTNNKETKVFIFNDARILTSENALALFPIRSHVTIGLGEECLNPRVVTIGTGTVTGLHTGSNVGINITLD